MSVALPGPAPKPRPLPADEPLSAQDYRRVVGVVEAVDQAVELAEFRERLVRALRSWFGFQGIAPELPPGRGVPARDEQQGGLPPLHLGAGADPESVP